jgi:tRNA pseudouridine32 synthase/23S rRNA pseudouridine746 synthase
MLKRFIVFLIIGIYGFSSFGLDKCFEYENRVNIFQQHEKVLYCDDDLIVMDKPPNILSAPGFKQSMSLAEKVATDFNIDRIDKMIVHRLDYATSGVLLFARNENALKNLNFQFRQRNNKVYKMYNAIVDRRVDSYEGEIDLPLGRDPLRGPPFCKVDTIAENAKKSLTHWSCNAIGKHVSQLNLYPKTGRFNNFL